MKISLPHSIETPSFPLPTFKSTVRKIVEKALSPNEWTAFPDLEPSGAGADPEVEGLLLRWEKLILLKADDLSAFEKRLQTLGLDRSGAIARLKSRTLPIDASLPDWGELLSEVLTPSNFAQPIVTVEQLQNWTDEEIDKYKLNLSQTPTFPEFLHPFVSVVMRRIRLQLPNLREIITDNAYQQIARYLLLRLSTVSIRVVAYEVKQWRFQGKLVGQTSEERYQYFVQEVLGTPEGLSQLFCQYPVLARLLAVCSEQMVEVTVELLQRLQQDAVELESTFLADSNLGLVASLLMGLSDVHGGGRTVCILRFTNHLKLVYKPRSFEIDRAFNNLSDWLNRTGETPKWRLTRIQPQLGYGWSEFIPAAECTTKAQIAEFYQRQGCHVALMYFLCGMDFHCENFIPYGEWPIPIDLEAILMTGMHTLPENLKQLPRYLQPPGICTVLSNNMTCYWRAGDYDQILFAASGINGCGDRTWPLLSSVWEGLGTDGLKLTRQYWKSYFDENLPRWQGEKIPVNDYLNEVVEGFSATYRTILQHRHELLHPRGPLAAFRTVTTRSLLRDTSEYIGILFWTLAPDQLRSGAAYDVALEILYGMVPTCASTVPLPTLLDEEKRCLWQQDIPIYHSSPSSLHIYSSHGTQYGPVVERTSFEQMQQRLQTASEEDLIWQSELLRVSLQMAIHPGGKQVLETETQNQDQLSLLSLQSSTKSQQWLWVSGWSGFSGNTIDNQQLKTDNQQQATDDQSVKVRLLNCAVELGEALAQLAMSHVQGNSWLSLCRAAKHSPMVNPIHPFPWNSMGASGTSIFLANLARQTGNERYEKLARGALKFQDSMLQQFVNTKLWDEIPISGFNGIYLPVYAWVECGRCLQDESLIDRALDLALKNTPQKLRSYNNPDVLLGAAGAVLVLLHLYKLRPEARLLEQATHLAEGILKCQQGTQGPNGWWVPNFERPLLGMGHGAAGIAYALLRLYALTGQEQLRLSAESGLAYERAHFCHTTKDWPDFRQEPGKVQFMTGWCAGAPGIGLSRLGILGILNDESEILDEIELAIAATQRHLGKHQHHLCCGEAGRIAFLSAAAQRLERPELLAVAKSAGLKMIDFYECVGHWRLQEFSERSIIPGLLDGVSGIGLTLLGLISPELTSQVMLLD